MNAISARFLLGQARFVSDQPREAGRRSPRLIAVCEGRDNNLNLIRILAALAVLVSHAWPLTLGPEAVQPLAVLTGLELGTQAVYVFFAISGFLIARSFVRHRTLQDWVAARAMRIFPALAVALVLTAFVVGPLVTALPPQDYAGDFETWTYVPRGLSLAFRQPELPGVFQDVAYHPETNGSLWTLQYEVMCYAAVMIMGLAGAFRSGPLLALFAVAFVVGKVLTSLRPDLFVVDALIFMRLGTPFACGIALWVARSWVPLSPILLVGLVGLVVLAQGTPLQGPLHIVALSYGTFVLAYLPNGWLRRYNLVGDYSYGVYIYAWPVQQAVVHWLGPLGPGHQIVIAAPVVLLLAIVSWHLIEKPALRSVGNGHRGRPVGADEER